MALPYPYEKSHKSVFACPLEEFYHDVADDIGGLLRTADGVEHVALMIETDIRKGTDY
jgi:hypothetical protein